MAAPWGEDRNMACDKAWDWAILKWLAVKNVLLSVAVAFIIGGTIVLMLMWGIFRH